MGTLSKKQVAGREKTLIAALLLSMWAPLATGIAVILSQSTTQLADFIRRTVELLALFISWQIFRYTEKSEKVSPEQKVRLEKFAGFSVTVALTLSGLTMFMITASRISTFEPGGNVYPGIIIAFLGLVTNSWFLRRYTKMTRENYNAVIDAQRLMYRAKAFVDFFVIVGLTAVAIAPTAPVTPLLDALGSLAVAAYLVWSGVGTLRNTINLS